ncbi:MAG: hypothetical protein GY863_23515 [bacterium]|nr:hypothetical protein [bacterium]
MDKGLAELNSDKVLRETFKITNEEIEKLDATPVPFGKPPSKDTYIEMLFAIRRKPSDNI